VEDAAAYGTAPPRFHAESVVSGSSSPPTPVARHGGRAPHTLVFANTRVGAPGEVWRVLVHHVGLAEHAALRLP
jgi:hypothetical protein